jgi:hypothetical protein
LNSQNQILIEDAEDQGPHHLAKTVLRALSVSALEPPEESLLQFFFDVLYQVSFRGEQGQPYLGRVVWQSPVNRPDSAKSEHLLLMKPVPLTVSSLTSLLAAAQPQSALLVSGGGNQALVIQGIIRRSAALSPPALFSVDILGPAHLKVDAGLDCPLELRRNRLHLTAQKVFERGPVRGRLSALLQDLFPAIQAVLPGDIAASPLLSAGAFPLPGGKVLMNEQEWPETLEQFWISALISLLGRILGTGLGGLVVLTRHHDDPPQKEEWAQPPHEAVYSHLRHLLEQSASQAIIQQVQSVRSLSERLTSPDSVPDDLALYEPLLPLEAPEHDPEIAQALQFLSSLARVDGLLRLGPHLDLIGFGGQPSPGRLPERVYLAGDELASEAHLSPISSRSFGPRNQALLRLCQQDPDSVGFALTQEGDARAMLWHEGKLVIWNTVLLPRR